MTSRPPKSVWRDLTDTPGEALDLELRSQLLMQLQTLLEERAAGGALRNLSPEELVAVRKGSIHALTLTSLVRIAAALGCEAEVKLRLPYARVIE
ncbi:hypothetical protein GCM10025759_04750 [Lysobacter panacisoli]|uniref:XRE family transcriptional regulator n=1 Tax=Lysobacter panacisoli TaxID=1255263 RepID=A0ABP9L402_9GAMM